MGFENRDYYREDEGTSGFRFGSDMSLTVRIIIVCGVLFLVNLFVAGESGNWLQKQLSLSPDTLMKPWLWYRYLTHGFMHDPSTASHIFWTLLGLFFFGPEIERLYGWREYLRYYLTTLVLGGIIWSVHAHLRFADSPFTYFGANAPVTAVTLLFCMRFPERSIMLFGVIPVPAWAVGAMIVVSNLSALLTNAWLGAEPSIVAVAFAVLYYKFGWHLGNLPGLSAAGRAMKAMQAWFKRRPSLKVFQGDATTDSEYSELEAAADRVLDKLHRDGEGSLSRQEKQLLERYSRLMRQKHR